MALRNYWVAVPLKWGLTFPISTGLGNSLRKKLAGCREILFNRATPGEQPGNKLNSYGGPGENC